MDYTNWDVSANGRLIARFLRQGDAEDFLEMKETQKPDVVYELKMVELNKSKAVGF